MGIELGPREQMRARDPASGPPGGVEEIKYLHEKYSNKILAMAENDILL